MMLKRAFSVDSEPAVHLIEPGSRMTKVAGMLPMVEEFMSRLKPDPKFMFTLVNAMGYSEFFGPNSNRDYYGHNPHLDFNGLLHAPENCGCHGEFKGWQTDPVVQQRVAKSWPFGYPSYYGATVYAHHKNSDPNSLGFGDVVFAAPNEAMKRIELVMRVDTELAGQRGHSAILDRIARGDRVDVSMGCKVPFDLCSICTDWDTVKKAWKGYDKARHSSPGVAILAYHRTVKPIRGLAITKADYCSHMVEQPGATLDDGRKVFVYNDFPRFFDISFVWVGADRTARVMFFMSSHGSRTGMKRRPSSISEIVKGASDMSKTAHAEPIVVPTKKAELKQSEMEKEIPGGLARKIEICANGEMDMPFGALAPFSKQHGMKTLLSTLAGLGIVLKPHEFHEVVGAHHPLQAKIASMAAERNMTFRTSLGGHDVRCAIDPSLFSLKLAQELMPYVPGRSSFAPHLHYRLGTMSKLAAKPVSQLIDAVFVHDVAALYNGYRASLVKEAAGIMPRYFEVVPPTPEDTSKTASLAGLLLSSPTVVHWVSAHLEKVADAEVELGTAVKYVMNNSSDYRKLSALGAEVCIAMDRSPNFISAVKAAVKTAL